MSDSTSLEKHQLRVEKGDRPWWQRIWGEARTRILLVYVLLMVGVAACSVPVFYVLLLSSIDNRVREDLSEEMSDFREDYQIWEQTSGQSVEDLKAFIDDFLAEELPEDDNFFIALVDGQFYKSSPTVLLEPFRPDSPLVKRWISLTEPVEGKQSVDDSEVGSVIYLVQPIQLENQTKGVFITAHSTAGEQLEALAAVYLFGVIAIAVVMISFLLAWFATGRVLQPVRELASTARLISESDLKQRIPPVQGSGELVDLSRTFNAMMDRIQTAFDSQRDFVNDAGHELRTPITIIQGHLELMGDDPDEQAETKALIDDELQRMGRFVNDLILLAKAERADFLQLETMDVAVFTEELFAKATALAPRNWQLVNKGVGKIVGDRQRLTGALINLAQNATQHTQNSDLIELGVVVVRQEVRFWVRDSGEGIAPADQQRIFERFARAANSYRRSEGAGLGLSIVRAIAEAHHGKVELVSQLGVGSTFSLVLPIDPQLP